MRRVQLYDTLAREVRLFAPITPPKVGLFVCGLTPYAEAHVGHARTMVTFDVLARALRAWGYRVFSIQNVTNLDDRLIARGGQEGVDPLVLADRHFRSWLGAAEELAIRSVNYYPYATDYLPEILAQIGQLVDGGFAYASRGSVYFDVAKAPGYGALSGQKVDQLRAGARVEVDRDKRSAEDFVLWKAASPGEPSWESPWGPGRPGWHIEDTAITVRLLGPRYDIHGGGVDLKFPHHEAEIAQAESATGESPLVRYWMHGGMLTLGGEKMSKSVGNVIGLRSALDEFGGEVLRFYYLNAHYRSPLDFVPAKSLPEAREAYGRLAGPARRLRERLGGEELPDAKAIPSELQSGSSDTVQRMDDHLANDLQTREAIAELFQWTRAIASPLQQLDQLSAEAVEALAAPFEWARTMLGLFDGPNVDARQDRGFVDLVNVALRARSRARARGDFAESDQVRAELLAAGVAVEDGAGGPRWERRREAA